MKKIVINVMCKTEFLSGRKNAPFLLVNEKSVSFKKMPNFAILEMGAPILKDIKGMKFKRLSTTFCGNYLCISMGAKHFFQGEIPVIKTVWHKLCRVASREER